MVKGKKNRFEYGLVYDVKVKNESHIPRAVYAGVRDKDEKEPIHQLAFTSEDVYIGKGRMTGFAVLLVPDSVIRKYKGRIYIPDATKVALQGILRGDSCEIKLDSRESKLLKLAREAGV